MEIVQFVDQVTEFFRTHLLVSAAVLAVAGYYLYKNPKESFKFLVFIAILAGVGYLILNLGSSTDSSVSTKGELTRKTKKALGE